MARHTVIDPSVTGSAPSGALVGTLFFSGSVTGVDVRTATLPDDPARQAELAFDNLATTLAHAGLAMENVGHLTVWYASHDHKRSVHAPWARHFPDVADRPARHSMVKALPQGCAIQLEAMAVKDARRHCVREIPGVSHGDAGPAEHSIPFGVRTGQYAFSAATFGRNGMTGEVPETAEGQIAQAYENNRIFLDHVGLSPEHLAHLYAWHSGDDLRPALEAEWARQFSATTSRPARNVVARELPGRGRRAQLEVIAVAAPDRSNVDLPTAPGVERPRPGGCRIGGTFFSSAVPGIAAAGPAESAFDDVQRLLDAAGFELSDVGRVTAWVSDAAVLADVDRVWRRAFPDEGDRPVRRDVVSTLPGRALVELDVVAAHDSAAGGGT